MEKRGQHTGSGLAAHAARLLLGAALAVPLSGCQEVLSRVSDAPPPAYYSIGEQWTARRTTVDDSRCLDSAKACDLLNARYYCRCVPAK